MLAIDARNCVAGAHRTLNDPSRREVESPINSSYAYQTKRLLYMDGGVPEYWIVSPDTRTIARWRGTEEPGEILSRQLVWQPEGMTTPLVLDLADFFAEALG